MKRAFVFIFIILATVVYSATLDQMQQVRDYVSCTSAISERKTHAESSLLALQLFADACRLNRGADPEKSQTNNNEKTPYELWKTAESLALLYDFRLEESLSVDDPNALTPAQSKRLIEQTDQLIAGTEERMIDAHINTLTAPLRQELTKELQKPRSTYISGGIERQAVSERVVRLRDEIHILEQSKKRLHFDMNTYYRQAKVQLLMSQRQCDRPQAEKFVDAWADRWLDHIAKEKAAAQRKSKQQNLLESRSQRIKRQLRK